MPKVKRPKYQNRHKGPKGYPAGGPGQVKLLGMVVHCTVSNPIDGPGDRNGVIDYLASKGLSVPVTIDDEGGTEMVARPYCGIHALGIRYAHGVEQIGQAVWTRKQWLDHRKTIQTTAREAAWLLHEVMGLPVTKKNLKRFVVGHVDDHKFGGDSTHWDPGPGYPWDVFWEEAIAHASEVGWRITATKDDEKKARQFRLSKSTIAWAWARKKAKRGYRVVIQRKKLRHGDLDE